ncbi:MAG: phage tail assembly chaperone, partial [Plesiomonas shigelloides]
FYMLGWNSEIPEDAIEISEDLHRHLIEGLSSNKKIAIAKDGTPFLEDIEKTDAQLASEIRSKRNEYLGELDKVILRHRREVELGATTKLTDAQFKTVLQIAQDLANVPEQATFPKSVTWPTQPAWLVDPDGDE